MNFSEALTDRGQPEKRARLFADHWPSVVYAIGDVHGCLEPLEALHARIVSDAARFEGTKLIVCLGDYIDRGPRSADVLEFLLRPLPQGLTRICLAGNHEAMLLDFMARPTLDSSWLQNGGLTTLASYGIDPDTADADVFAECMIRKIPANHFEFLRKLAVTLVLPGVCFVHAGLAPNVSIEDQSEHDMLWIRKNGAEGASAFGRMIVHGHTPAAQPVVTPTRICVDTGVGTTGVLTAVRLIEGQQPFILQATQISEQHRQIF